MLTSVSFLRVLDTVPPGEASNPIMSIVKLGDLRVRKNGKGSSNRQDLRKYAQLGFLIVCGFTSLLMQA